MNFKKILSATAASALALSAFAVTASADQTVIDFENGDCSFVYMNVDDPSADPSILTVEEFNGSKALKVDVTNPTNTPKIWFDLDSITARENTIKIKTIEMTISVVPKTEEITVGWAGGAIGTAGGFDLNGGDDKGQVNPGWSDGAWDGGAYNPGEVWTGTISKKFLLPTQRYTAEGVNPFFGLMRWASTEGADYYIYIDDVKLLDDDGNALPLTEIKAAPASAPAPETPAASPATGNASVVSLGAIAALAAAAVVLSRKK